MRSIVIFPLFVFLLACQDSGHEAPTIPAASTSKNHYYLGEGIAVTISNEGKAPLLLLTCCGSDLVYHLDRYESGTWVLHTSNVIPCSMMMCPSNLVYVSQSHPHESAIGCEIEEKGTYRLRFITGEWPDTEELISNSFFVE